VLGRGCWHNLLEQTALLNPPEDRLCPKKAVPKEYLMATGRARIRLAGTQIYLLAMRPAVEHSATLNVKYIL